MWRAGPAYHDRLVLVALCLLAQGLQIGCFALMQLRLQRLQLLRLCKSKKNRWVRAAKGSEGQRDWLSASRTFSRAACERSECRCSLSLVASCVSARCSSSEESTWGGGACGKKRKKGGVAHGVALALANQIGGL